MTKYAFLLSLFIFPLLDKHAILDHILPYKFVCVLCMCVCFVFVFNF